jgi:hypothetical protein
MAALQSIEMNPWGCFTHKKGAELSSYSFDASVMAETPLSTRLTDLRFISLSKLTGMSEKLIMIGLRSLHSVFIVSSDETTPVSLFYPSFRDFSLGQKTREKTGFWVDGKEMHQKLTFQCLNVTSRNLKKNIYNLPGHGT